MPFLPFAGLPTLRTGSAMRFASLSNTKKTSLGKIHLGFSTKLKSLMRSLEEALVLKELKEWIEQGVITEVHLVGQSQGGAMAQAIGLELVTAHLALRTSVAASLGRPHDFLLRACKTFRRIGAGQPHLALVRTARHSQEVFLTSSCRQAVADWVGDQVKKLLQTTRDGQDGSAAKGVLSQLECPVHVTTAYKRQLEIWLENETLLETATRSLVQCGNGVFDKAAGALTSAIRRSSSSDTVRACSPRLSQHSASLLTAVGQVRKDIAQLQERQEEGFTLLHSALVLQSQQLTLILKNQDDTHKRLGEIKELIKTEASGIIAQLQDTWYQEKYEKLENYYKEMIHRTIEGKAFSKAEKALMSDSALSLLGARVHLMKEHLPQLLIEQQRRRREEIGPAKAVPYVAALCFAARGIMDSGGSLSYALANMKEAKKWIMTQVLIIFQQSKRSWLQLLSWAPVLCEYLSLHSGLSLSVKEVIKRAQSQAEDFKGDNKDVIKSAQSQAEDFKGDNKDAEAEVCSILELLRLFRRVEEFHQDEIKEEEEDCFASLLELVEPGVQCKPGLHAPPSWEDIDRKKREVFLSRYPSTTLQKLPLESLETLIGGLGVDAQRRLAEKDERFLPLLPEQLIIGRIIQGLNSTPANLDGTVTMNDSDQKLVRACFERGLNLAKAAVRRRDPRAALALLRSQHEQMLQETIPLLLFEKPKLMDFLQGPAVLNLPIAYRLDLIEEITSFKLENYFGASSRDRSESEGASLHREGMKYYYGAPGLSPDKARAMKLVKEAAQLNYAEAGHRLFEWYINRAVDTVVDEKMAVKCLMQAAKQQHAGAQLSLGDFYYTGKGGLEKDERKAVELYKKAADQGHAAAQRNLGVCYAYEKFASYKHNETMRR
eukprot:g3771.t1